MRALASIRRATTRPGLDVGVRQDHGEFVAADSKGAVAAPDGTQRDATHRREELIAEGVPLLVIDLLEVVHVHEQQGQGRAVSRGLLELAAEFLLEGAMVAQPGQAVEERVLAGLTVQVDQARPLIFHLLQVAQDRA